MGCVAGSDSVGAFSLLASWDESPGGDDGCVDASLSPAVSGVGGGGGSFGIGKSLCAI